MTVTAKAGYEEALLLQAVVVLSTHRNPTMNISYLAKGYMTFFVAFSSWSKRDPGKAILFIMRKND